MIPAADHRPSIPLPSVERSWSIGVFSGHSPFALQPRPAPSLAARNVTDARAWFVADPFLARSASEWHLFFEVCARPGRRGRIGHARSADGAAWHYGGIALEEPFHLSYPCVFNDGRDWFMVPECLTTHSVRLYRAADFPGGWTLDRVLIAGRPLVDPTVFQHEGLWWLLAASDTSDALFVFHADRPRGPWREHPASPVLRGAPHRARPAGRPFAVDGRLYRPAQDVSAGYGRRANAAEIVALTPRHYEEADALVPLVGPGACGWNARGMHHVDTQPDPRGGWIAAVDGFRLDVMLGYRRLPDRST